MLESLRSALIVGAIGLVMACSVGCGGSSDPRPAVTELKEGLNVLKTDGAIVGAFRKGDHAIYFETHAGDKTLDVYRNLDPSLPAQEMSFRVMDENGRTFFVQQGGDTLPEAWEKDIAAEATRPRVDPLKRADDFALMKEAAIAMEGASIPVTVQAHKLTLRNARLAVRDELLRPAVEKQLATVGYAPANNSIELHGKWIIWGVAEHTATWSNVNGVIKDNCQHGSCASSMSHWCTASGTGATQYVEMSTSNSSVTGNCTTSYNWNSTGGGHNCHDDSVRAIWGVKYGPQGSSTSGVCNNGASHWYGPGCNETSW
ncbi:MAG: hypothetical protein HUU28_13470 [Planctomycetaceae bacterium]|nr:hypothetical protein [Planctomycetaceae bacterium]